MLINERQTCRQVNDFLFGGLDRGKKKGFIHPISQLSYEKNTSTLFNTFETKFQL